MWNVAFSLEETLKSRGVCTELRNRGLMQAIVLEKRLRLVALLRRTDEVFQESRLLQHLVHRLLQIICTKVFALVLQHVGKSHQIDPTRSQRHGIECTTHQSRTRQTANARNEFQCTRHGAHRCSRSQVRSHASTNGFQDVVAHRNAHFLVDKHIHRPDVGSTSGHVSPRNGNPGRKPLRFCCDASRCPQFLVGNLHRQTCPFLVLRRTPSLRLPRVFCCCPF